jgi:RHS repeat-associated protein
MLAGAILGSNATSSVTKDAATAITGNLNGGTAFSQLIAPDITSPNGQLAKAYLNVVFFDERFTFVQEGSTSARVGSAGVAATLALLNIKVPKNGYCLVYISNESDEPVYFDNLQVRHDRGRILEENHYYAYGLKIAALSSKAFAAPQNNYQYQGDYSEFDDDLGWNDFMLRSYDPQLGRFLQWDPYDEFASGYVGMGNDPANLTDPNGGCTNCLTGLAATLQSIFGTLQPVTVIGQVKTLTTATKVSLSFVEAGAKLLSHASNLAWNMAGFSAALSDNAFGTNLLTNNAPGSLDGSAAWDNWNAGVTAGNAASLAIATMEGGLGQSLMTGGGIATATVVGAEVGVPAAAAGGALTLHSIYFIHNALNNTVKGSGQVKFESEIPEAKLSTEKFEQINPPPANGSSNGRSGKQQKLKEIVNDPKASSSDRGWIKQEQNSIKRRQRKNVRVPPGKNLAHKRGKEARKGHSYGESHLNDIDLHKTQHRIERIKKKKND